MNNKITARINRESRTISVMLMLYCKKHHVKNGPDICTDCQNIGDYAIQRLQKCPFIANKPTCAKCLIHCYNKDMKNKVKEVMRYSGPRLLLSHPILALSHLFDERIKPLPFKRKKLNKKTKDETL